MKVSIGSNIVKGPWGGGNLFAINLSEYLVSNGHNVVYDLNDNDIDIILLTDPRKSSESSAFTHKEILKYKKKVNKDTLVVHRINECDQRKNTKGLNKKYIKINNKVSDYTIFVSEWLYKIYVEDGFSNKNYKVILAGANKLIFNNLNGINYDNSKKLKIVTHHWSNNWNKGFDIYTKLDNLLNDTYWDSRYEFSYIGNIPKNLKFKNCTVIPPLSGNKLASQLKQSHLYLTASINEPSGNHHIEAAQCGLPVLYLESGGMPEYCKNYGLAFEYDNFEEKLELIRSSFLEYKNKVNSYKYNSDDMSESFLNVFKYLLENKERIDK